MYLFFYILEKFATISNSPKTQSTGLPGGIAASVELLGFMDENIAKTYMNFVRVVVAQNSIFFNDKLDSEIKFYSIIISIYAFLAILVYLRFILPQPTMIQSKVLVSVKTLRIIPKQVIDTLPVIRNVIISRLYA
jgi:hypothetical protein